MKSHEINSNRWKSVEVIYKSSETAECSHRVLKSSSSGALQQRQQPVNQTQESQTYTKGNNKRENRAERERDRLFVCSNGAGLFRHNDALFRRSSRKPIGRRAWTHFKTILGEDLRKQAFYKRMPFLKEVAENPLAEGRMHIEKWCMQQIIQTLGTRGTMSFTPWVYTHASQSRYRQVATQ